MYSFKAKIASRDYHVFKETSWGNAKEGDEVKVELETNKSSKKIDPYACVIRAKEEYFKGWKTVGYMPREISRHVYFFIKSGGGSVNGTVISTKYRTSPIPAGGLEIPLLLTFSCSKTINFEKMKTFVQTLYDYKFTGTVIEEENSDDEDEIIVINENDSQTANNCTQLVGLAILKTRMKSRTEARKVTLNMKVKSRTEARKVTQKTKMKTRAAKTYQFLTMKVKSKLF